MGRLGLTGKASGTTPATPTVQWNWGTVLPNVGQLLSVSSSASTTTYNSYDALGRPGSSSQATPTGSTAYNFSYSYKPIGLSSVTYPSGRTISYCYDTAHCYDIDGRPTAVTGTLSGATTYYANSALYASHGSIQQLTLGSSANNVQQACYNSRFQTVGIRLGPSATASCANSGSDLLNLSYGYGTTNNNGNLQSQTITRYLQGATLQRSQSYGYNDGVNRLTSASESLPQSWSENFGYDTYGNRWVVNPSGLPPLTNETPQGPGWYPAKNQISGWTYDGAGNINSISGLFRSYSYDAENRLAKAITDTNNPGTTTSTYSYDGDGRRVQKTTPSGTTIFVYDAAGQLAAEYSTVPNTTSGPEYLTADHLGSTRLVTDANGNTTKCYDYLPFGEEIPNGYGGRTASCFGTVSYPSAPDVVSEKFTGKERDAETGLDFFGARYISSPQGRFTSPDPIQTTSQKLRDPQQWNMYAYVRNNPLRLIDPTGMYVTDCAEDDKKCKKRIDKFEKARQKDLTSKNEAVRDAAGQYGDRGIDNGVTVRVLTNEQMMAAVGLLANGATMPVQGEDEDRVNIFINSDLSGKDLQRTIAHEGTHLGMDLDFINGFNPDTGKYDPNLNFTHGQTEFISFMTGAAVKKYDYPAVPCGGSPGCKFGPQDAAKINQFLHNSPVYGPIYGVKAFPPGVWAQ